MPDLRDLKTDCRQFRWDRPCAPHKREGVRCPECPHYDPVQHRLAVVKLAAVGDVLRTTSLLPAIHQRYPGAWITWVTLPDAVDLFPGNDLVDEVFTPDEPCLRVRRFHTVLCPDADPQTTAVAATLRADHRVGFTADDDGLVVPLGTGAHRWFRMGIDDVLKRSNSETYQSLIAAVLEVPAGAVAEPILEPSDAHLATARAQRAELSSDGKVVGINTGAGTRWRRKRWTVDHQRSLIAGLTSRGVSVLLLGGPEEGEVHRELRAASAGKPVASAGTDHSYRQFAAFVDQCDVLVTGDTLALHVACARKVPVVALFGPTSVAEIEVYGRGEKIAPTGLDCLGCYLPTCDVSPHCQERIDPDVVMAAVLRWLPR